METNRKLLKRSTTLLLSALRSDEAADRKFTKTSGVSAIFWRLDDFAAHLRPNASSNRNELKRCLIEETKSY